MEFLALFSVRHLRVRTLRMFAFVGLAPARACHGSVDAGHCAEAQSGEGWMPAVLCIKACLVIHSNTQALTSLTYVTF